MRSFSPDAVTAFMVRTILALAPQYLMGAFVSPFHTQPLSTNSSGRQASRKQRLSSVDVILPDIDAQLCPHGSQLVLLADSFVFDGLLAERLLESVEKN